MTDNLTQPTDQTQKKATAQGDFFIIDIEVWKNLYDDLAYSISANSIDDSKATRILASYLVLACGTGGDNITSRWSATACRKYAGFSNDTAKKAIEYLVNLGYISIKEKTAKTKSQNNTYKLTKPKQGNEIYLPKSLIMGVNGEITPITRLYYESNPHLLYLFIRLYAFQYKTLDIIDPSIISSLITKDNRRYPEIVYQESGRLNVWGISDFYSCSAYGNNALFDFDSHSLLFKSITDKGVWGFFGRLKELGLINSVDYACVGDDYSNPKEIDPICEIDTNTQIHFGFLLRCVSEYNPDKNTVFNNAILENETRVVLPANYQKVHFAKFYRLTYRTKLGDNLRFEQERIVNKSINDRLKALNLDDFTRNELTTTEKRLLELNLI